MEIKTTTEITFSAEELKKLIIQHLASKGYDVKLEDINYKIGSKYHPSVDPRDSYSIPVFDSVTAKVSK